MPERENSNDKKKRKIKSGVVKSDKTFLTFFLYLMPRLYFSLFFGFLSLFVIFQNIS